MSEFFFVCLCVSSEISLDFHLCMQGFTVSWWRRVLRHRRWLQVIVVVCLGYIFIVKLPSLITKVLRNTGAKNTQDLFFFGPFSTLLCILTLWSPFIDSVCCLIILMSLFQQENWGIHQHQPKPLRVQKHRKEVCHRILCPVTNPSCRQRLMARV